MSKRTNKKYGHQRLSESSYIKDIRYDHENDRFYKGGYHGSHRLATNYHHKNLQDVELFSKPITFTNYHVHRHHKKNSVQQSCHFDRVKAVQPKGVVFVWPKSRKFYYEKELAFILWTVSHTLYWLHVVNLFPNGAGLPLEQPPWNYTPPLPIPQTREYIIEPDWDSAYN